MFNILVLTFYNADAVGDGRDDHSGADAAMLQMLQVLQLLLLHSSWLAIAEHPLSTAAATHVRVEAQLFSAVE